MRILLLGKSGQLGSELHRTLKPLGTLLTPDRSQLDLETITSIRLWLRQWRPETIINAAGYTDVDRAESEPARVSAANSIAPAVLAEEAKRLGATLIHFSTDYIFDGKKSTPYTEIDQPNPLNIYGKSKLAGEQAIRAILESHFIFRTSWLYSAKGENFLTKVLKWSREKEVLHVAADQISSPTWAVMLSKITAQIMSQEKNFLSERYGTYHLTSRGSTNRFEWAASILELDKDQNKQVVRSLIPVPSSEFAAAAERPSYSVLGCGLFQSKFGIRRLGWKEGLEIAMK